MTKKLFMQALLWFLSGISALFLLVFLPAGTVDYPNGWLFLTVVFAPMLLSGVVLMKQNPQLLKKRLNTKEKLNRQRQIIKLSGLMFIAGFVLAGLDFRFGWTQLPGFVPPMAAACYLLGYVLYCEVLRENVYVSRTVEVQEGQRVVDTGLYSIIRHPMYSATLILFLAMPLMLGSALSFVCFLVYPAIIAKRIESEEALLEAELEGYTAYKQKVRYKLIPYLW